MPNEEIILDPVDHITVDALGKPGERIFYIHAIKGSEKVSIIIEKFQLQSLLEGIEDFFLEIQKQFPELEEPIVSFQEEKMRILPPIDPVFRAGDMGLAYDENRNLACIFAREAVPQDQVTRFVRFWCTRSQLIAFERWGAVVLQHGRQICPQCGQPMEPDGHFCPKKNGHKRKTI